MYGFNETGLSTDRAYTVREIIERCSEVYDLNESDVEVAVYDEDENPEYLDIDYDGRVYVESIDFFGQYKDTCSVSVSL